MDHTIVSNHGQHTLRCTKREGDHFGLHVTGWEFRSGLGRHNKWWETKDKKAAERTAQRFHLTIETPPKSAAVPALQ